MSHTSTVPAAVERVYPDLPRHPIVVDEFHPGRGWVTVPGYRKRITPSWARKLRREGITKVGLLIAPNRVADFFTAELTR